MRRIRKLKKERKKETMNILGDEQRGRLIDKKERKKERKKWISMKEKQIVRLTREKKRKKKEKRKSCFLDR